MGENERDRVAVWVVLRDCQRLVVEVQFLLDCIIKGVVLVKLLVCGFA